MKVRCVWCDWLVVTVRWAGCHESEVCLMLLVGCDTEVGWLS